MVDGYSTGAMEPTDEPDSGDVLLSACVIAKDEEEELPGCLASVAFCDEIIVVDSGSTDRTVAIAEEAGARVVQQPWLGFAAQRNVALDHARGRWVLEIDADERVSPELRDEVKGLVATMPDGVDLAGLPRREVLVGRPLGRAAKYPNYSHRLLRRGSYRHDELRTVHEGLVPHGPVHPCQNDLVHHFARTWRAALDDVWRYAKLEADQMTAPRTAQAVLMGAGARPAAKLLYRLTVDGGWRDGAHGAAKIAMDCATDAAVWIRYGLGLGRGEGLSGAAPDEHYGARRWPLGEPHVVLVAPGRRAARAAAAWASRAAGFDVVVLTDADADVEPRVRVRPPRGSGPVALARALDAEEQLRTIDAVLPVGRRARLTTRAVPSALLGVIDPPRALPDPAGLRAEVLRGRAERGL